MSNESTPDAALDRLVEVAAPAAKGMETFLADDGYRSLRCRTNKEIARSVLAAVLPALADELQRENDWQLEVMTMRKWDWDDWSGAIAHLRSLAAPADEPKAQS
jgi:hypothetical protein